APPRHLADALVREALGVVPRLRLPGHDQEPLEDRHPDELLSAAGRRKELNVRAALGSSPRRHGGRRRGLPCSLRRSRRGPRDRRRRPLRTRRGTVRGRAIEPWGGASWRAASPISRRRAATERRRGASRARESQGAALRARVLAEARHGLLGDGLADDGRTLRTVDREDRRIDGRHGAVGTRGPDLETEPIVRRATGVPGETERLALLDAHAGLELADETHEVRIANEATAVELEIDEVTLFRGAIGGADRARSQRDDRRAFGQAIDGTEVAVHDLDRRREHGTRLG